MKKIKKTQLKTRDLKKDSVFKELSQRLAAAGVSVRREKLKRGADWRAASGSCLLKDSKLIIVDQDMSQDDQLEFLRTYISELGLV